MLMFEQANQEILHLTCTAAVHNFTELSAHNIKKCQRISQQVYSVETDIPLTGGGGLCRQRTYFE
jgi:hypothetical protein